MTSAPVLFSGGPFNGFLMYPQYAEDLPQTITGPYRIIRMLHPVDGWTYSYLLGEGNVARYTGKSNDHDVLCGQREADAVMVDDFLRSIEGVQP